MRFSFSGWLVIILMGVWCSPVVAADLSKIDRSIAKEPAYQHKPTYCLLVFGPDAKTRVWVVLDGDVLYVDCNANGDLTEKGERVVSSLDPERVIYKSWYKAPTIQGAFKVSFSMTTLENGEKVIRQIRSQPEKGKAYHQRTHGFIHLSTKPKDAPIVHFGGPLTLTLMGWYGEVERFRKLTRGKDCRLSILVGTPVFGSKQEAFTQVNEDFSELIGGVFSRVEFEFPGKKSPVRMKIKTRY